MNFLNLSIQEFDDGWYVGEHTDAGFDKWSTALPSKQDAVNVQRHITQMVVVMKMKGNNGKFS